MARVVKWSVVAITTLVTFCLVVWAGAAVQEQVLPRSWADASRIATVIALASLLATIVFGVGKWWAERDPKPVPAQAPAPSPRVQTINGPVIGGSGVTGNIGGDVHNHPTGGHAGDGRPHG